MLLLGSELFAAKIGCVESILTLREKNPNSSPRKINQIFRALSRREYGMEGEFCFIKIVFLHLLGKLSLSIEVACKAYEAVTKPGLLAELSPFQQLLAVKAHDLILFERKPSKLEVFPQILEAIEALHGKLSLRQAVRLGWALPLKWWISGLASLLAILAFVFGFGQTSAEFWFKRDAERLRPTKLTISKSSDGSTTQIQIVRDLASRLLASRQPKPGNRLLLVQVDSSDFLKPTPKFSIEASQGNFPILEAYAFEAIESEGGQTLTVLPVQKVEGRVKALVPASDANARLVFILLFDIPSSVVLPTITGGLTLRPLE